MPSNVKAKKWTAARSKLGTRRRVPFLFCFVAFVHCMVSNLFYFEKRRRNRKRQREKKGKEPG